MSADRRLMVSAIDWMDGSPIVTRPMRLFDRTVHQTEYEDDYCPDIAGEQFLINTPLSPGSVTLLADWRRGGGS